MQLKKDPYPLFLDENILFLNTHFSRFPFNLLGTVDHDENSNLQVTTAPNFLKIEQKKKTTPAFIAS